jgi:hypothetical protein
VLTRLRALDTITALRRLLLALVVIGAAGLVVELILMKHYDSAWQWTPLVLLGFVLIASALIWRRPGSATLRLFVAVMLLCVVSGVVGVYLHYQGNVEFALEREPLRGIALFWKALRGATPALAPGAMAQLGLLGLVYSYRHPASRRDLPGRSSSTTTESSERP